MYFSSRMRTPSPAPVGWVKSEPLLKIPKELIAVWLTYMQHLKKHYPYTFSLAMRTNPFNMHTGAFSCNDRLPGGTTQIFYIFRDLTSATLVLHSALSLSGEHDNGACLIARTAIVKSG